MQRYRPLAAATTDCPNNWYVAPVAQTSDTEFRPGYPIDHRLPRKVARLLNGPGGDFECSAARVVARLTGERVVLQDDGSRAGMADIRIEYADRSPGYVEVWTDIEPGYAATCMSSVRARSARMAPEKKMLAE